MFTSLLLLQLSFVLATAVHADVPADQIERARLLRQLEETPNPVTAPSAPAGTELPGARLEIETLRARQALQSRQRADGLWRQTLGEQQTGKIRQEMTGIPSTGAAARAMGAERHQRMQDLSSRILQQDLQYRMNR